VTPIRAIAALLAVLSASVPGRVDAQTQASPAVAPRAVLEAIAAALGRDDVAAARTAVQPALVSYPDDPVVHNLAGVIEARRGESRPAQEHFERAIQLQPRSPGPYVNLGRLLQERAAADPAAQKAALAVYARLLAIDPQQPEALFQTARLQALDGRFDAARHAIDRLPDAARGRPPVLALRAVVLAGCGDAAGARSAVAALSAHPDLAREDLDAVLPALARLPAPDVTQRTEQRTEQAILELLDRRGWSTPATLRRLATIESAGGRYVEARAWLEKAAARTAPDAALLIDLARAAFKAGDPKGSLGYLAHARELEPTNVAVHFLFGIVCVELNLGAEAYESLAKAVALAPDDPDVNYAMGAVSLHRHDPSEALPYFEAYVRLRPGDPRGRFALGAAKFHSQRPEEARVDLAVAATDPRTAAGAHYYLARIARQQHDLETAGREIDAALQANPSHADGWAERGLIATRRGDYAAAEAALQKALALDPDNYEATLHLAALYGRTRDPRRAAQEARLQALVARRETRAQEFLRLVQAVP
jgi:tetratricopeptide (TPR) repeat protein